MYEEPPSYSEIQRISKIPNSPPEVICTNRTYFLPIPYDRNLSQSKIRGVAIPLSIFSTIFGCLCCSMPALTFAFSKSSNDRNLRTSIILSAFSLVTGISVIAVVLTILIHSFSFTHDDFISPQTLVVPRSNDNSSVPFLNTTDIY